MVTGMPRGDLVGWIIDWKDFGQGKPNEFPPWIKETLCTHTGCGIRTHDLPVIQWWL